MQAKKKGAADAIKKSLKTLEIAGLKDADEAETCHFATDNGGGAGLKNIEPRLRENKVLGPTAGADNCQYHGHNKGYENASIAAFGPNGLGKANIFQAAYQYSYMNEVFEQNSEAFKSLMSQLLNLDVDKLPEPNEMAGCLDEMIQSASEPLLSKIESDNYTKNITSIG
ncbi:hypothetical protein THAOC_06013 [Thalassiosira oceanica]|uniref:Uncharacterized protein n=1 Tax=Thalassiosira oceanica TaxID=159749 RepID=K0TM71_THAOC|nr:hypothetical protein THAOC_06013 [Thalassiosira oceanica]|eukprot:EJK72457.1 hypothetical protein THAOC_06013 [Thalassiosira oceanica]